MSEGRRVRLPLAPTDPEELPPVDDSLRLPFERPSLALVGVEEGLAERALAVLRDASAAAGRSFAEVHAVLSTREGVRREGARVEASLLEMPEALLAAERALPPHDLVLATGVALVAIRRPSVSILVTRGRAPGDWPMDVRSVRHRFELVVPELDVALARELVARL